MWPAACVPTLQNDKQQSAEKPQHDAYDIRIFARAEARRKVIDGPQLSRASPNSGAETRGKAGFRQEYL